MKDELVRRAPLAALMCIAIGFSGCNGCSGCEGQTPDPTALPPTLTGGSNETPALPGPAASTEQAAPATPSAAAALAPGASNPEHDPTGVRRCCKSINDNLAAASEKHRPVWKSALDACNQAVEKNTGRKGLESVRELLTPLGWPAACQ
jgi:hypothetical protein